MDHLGEFAAEKIASTRSKRNAGVERILDIVT